ncbi:unnamed protein product [Blepharisma stoltei]|uniref:RRM domain-containing protein n=1 Tax=Blepharisma stoltei TaxID=1481888 RepID=A0AAU9JBL8_9CILI|nr:unnamed protein product [Blepharisma stoltei]
MYSRNRNERSRSPDQKIKLHVTNLPVQFPQGQLITLFSNYGPVGKVRVIRNGPKGFPLRQHCYAFIEMENLADAQKAVEDLNTRGWEVALSKDSKNALSRSTEIMWPGCLTRCSSLRVNVRAKVIKGLVHSFLKSRYQIDINHRARPADLPSYPPKFIITIEAAEEDERTAFMEHIHYFQRKDRVGVASFEGETLFIIPPGEKAEGIYEKMRLDQMLGGMWGEKEETPRLVPQLRAIQGVDEIFKPENTFAIAPAP